jgi:adenylate cyclase
MRFCSRFSLQRHCPRLRRPRRVPRPQAPTTPEIPGGCAGSRAKSAIARYMDPWLADRLLADGGTALGGQSTEATILFADIRGFTRLAEQLGAQNTVGVLNEYFTLMVDCVVGEAGMLDKFIGDALMATFGIPLAGGDEADRAVGAAVAMLRALRHWNLSRRQHLPAPLAIGIGIHTDRVVSGNIGSPKRMEFTVIGDGVNLAARLQQVCKAYEVALLISEATRLRLRRPFRLRRVDIVRLRGRTDPVELHEVLDYSAQSAAPPASALDHYEAGIAAYRERRYGPALAHFERAAALAPSDRLSHIYVHRCRALARTPPAADWDGAWIVDDGRPACDCALQH